MKNKLKLLIAGLLIVIVLAGCSEASRVSQNVSPFDVIQSGED